MKSRLNSSARAGWRLFGSLLLLAATWACTDTRPPGPTLCATTADCPDGQLCVSGACRTACTTSTDCPTDQVCVSGACLTSCTTDADCPRGEECEFGYCKVIPPDDGGDGDGGSSGCVDQDRDGYGRNCAAGPDCDDSDRSVHPNADEVCSNGRDDDCDGQTDEADCGCTVNAREACYSGPVGSDGRGICHAGVRVCQQDRTWGQCLGERLPEGDTETDCDGRDENCDGQTDEGLVNACGVCGPLASELCGNGLDDDCNGQVDENCDCDPNCQCEGAGAGQQCTCHPPTDQPCYSGPPGTLGFGRCHGGIHDCVLQPDGSYAWSTCQGEVLPAPECGVGSQAGVDDDCDGSTDEGCLPDLDGDGYAPPDDCNDQQASVYPGAPEVCDGLDQNCNGIVDEGVSNACGGCGAVPEESCGDGLDNDCDGAVDEGCGGCSGGQSRDCYSGPPGTAGVGQCIMGTQTCDGEFWSDCEGDVPPDPEVCDGVDNDCDTEADEQWAIGANACGYCDSTELCDGLDNDCDGLTDEGLRNSCGNCIGCASDADCAHSPNTVCDPVAGRCSETVCNELDDDCDGLIDEGLLNACGTCGESCYEQEWGGAGDWQYGSSDGVSNTVNPDELQLDSETQSPHYIWIAGTTTVCDGASGCLSSPGCYAGTTCHTVKKFDTRTNQLIGVYSSWGWSPSRTAVAIDNSVWVGNRGCQDNLSNCQGDNPQHGNASHLDADGNLLCRADATGTVAVRAVTLDKNGDAWIGSWNGGVIIKYSGSEVDSNPDGIPRCRELCRVNLGGSRAYGAAVDSNGYLWIATLDSGAVRKIDTATCTLVDTIDTGYQTYGVAIDQDNNPWYGCWTGTCPCGAIKINAATRQVQCIGRSVGNTAGGETRGVAVDWDGNIWVAEWAHNTVSKFSPAGVHLGQWAVSGFGYAASGPLGMAIDFDHQIWAVDYGSGHASKYSSDGTQLAVFPVGSNPYTYSDMTGYQLRTITLKHGTWTVDFDSGYADAIWDRVEWSGRMGIDDRIRIRARTAPTEGALVSASWTGYYEADPAVPPPWSADISGAVPDNRWIQIEVTLNTEDDISPAFSGLRVLWQR